MKQYAYLGQLSHPYFKKALTTSLILHGSLFVVAIVAPLLPLLQGKGALTYTSTIRVDIVDLPDQRLYEIEKDIMSTQDSIKSLKKEIDTSYQDKDALKFNQRLRFQHFKPADSRNLHAAGAGTEADRTGSQNDGSLFHREVTA